MSLHTEIYGIFIQNIHRLNSFLRIGVNAYNYNLTPLDNVINRLSEPINDINNNNLKVDDFVIELDEIEYEVLSEAMIRYKKIIIDFLPFILNQLVIFSKSIFDFYILDLLWNYHCEYFEFLKNSEKNISYKEIFSYLYLDELKEEVITKEIQKVGFLSFDQMIKYLKDVLGLDLSKSSDLYNKMLEICEIRNILIHNKGVINNRFLEKINNDKYNINEKIELDINEVIDYLQIITDYVSTIDLEAKEKLFIDKKTYSLYN